MNFTKEQELILWCMGAGIFLLGGVIGSWFFDEFFVYRASETLGKMLAIFAGCSLVVAAFLIKRFFSLRDRKAETQPT